MSIDNSENIPGAQAIGFGFNITGRYNIDSVTLQLFQEDTDATTFTIPGQATYSVPGNIAPILDSNTFSVATTATSQTDFVDKFSASMELSASSGCFSGEFDAAFSSTNSSSNQTYYSWYDGSHTNYTLSIKNIDPTLLTSSVTSDINDLPDAFDPDTPDAFMAFINKYGTHFVTKVTMGVSLRYYVAVDTSYSSDAEEISSSVTLEYNAVFTDATAKAQADWSTLSQKWASSRTVTIDAVGGDASLMPAGIPGYGENIAPEFQNWVDSVYASPAVVRFGLTPVDQLCGDKQQAMAQAINYYLNATVVVDINLQRQQNSITSTFRITAFGDTAPIPQTPAQPAPTIAPGTAISAPAGGFHMVFYDPDSFEILQNTIYYLPPPSFGAGYGAAVAAVYATMLNDVNAMASKNYIVALAGFGIYQTGTYPPTAIVSWLTHCGAQLSGWQHDIASSDYYAFLNYIFVGAPGAGLSQPLEKYQASEIASSLGAPILHTDGIILMTGE